MIPNTEVPLLFSSVARNAISEYKSNIGFLSKVYQEVESAKGRWHVRHEEFTRGRFPAREEDLNATLTSELNCYEDFVKAKEKSHTLFNLIQNTIDYFTQLEIHDVCYRKLQGLGYQTAEGKEGEQMLPTICTRLEVLKDRVRVIRDHMDDRLPPATKNLEAVFKVVTEFRAPPTTLEKTTNWLNGWVNYTYLNKALAEKQEKEKKLQSTPITTTQEAASPAKPVEASSTSTTPAKEVQLLTQINLELEQLSAEDPLSPADKEALATPKAQTPTLSPAPTSPLLPTPAPTNNAVNNRRGNVFATSGKPT